MISVDEGMRSDFASVKYIWDFFEAEIAISQFCECHSCIMESVATPSQMIPHLNSTFISGFQHDQRSILALEGEPPRTQISSVRLTADLMKEFLLPLSTTASDQRSCSRVFDGDGDKDDCFMHRWAKSCITSISMNVFTATNCQQRIHWLASHTPLDFAMKPSLRHWEKFRSPPLTPGTLPSPSFSHPLLMEDSDDKDQGEHCSDEDTMS